MQPGNFTGLTGLAPTAAAGSSGGVGATITVASGGDDSTAVSIPLVTRNTIANDATIPRPQIGRPSGDRSAVLPVGQFYRGGVRETVPARPSSETPGRQSSWSPRQSPIESTAIRLGGSPAPATLDVAGNTLKPAAGRTP
jgi:hypothetical protein